MTPAARVSINGKDISTALAGVLSSITVTDEAGIKSDTCTLVIDNRELFTAPPIGAELRVWLGYEPTPVYMGRYKVASWKKSGRPKILTVTARAAEVTDDLKARKTRSWHDTTVTAIVKNIAESYGLTPVVDAKIGARSIPHIDQQTESDMSFLSRLARRQGATFKLADGKVIFAAKGSKTLPSGAAKTAVKLAEAGLTSWEGGHEERGNYKSVVASYVEKGTGKHHRVTAGSGKPAHRDPRLYGSKAEATAAAAATLGDLARGKRTASVEMPGNPDFFAEALVSLSGFDPDVDGDYMAKTVTHSFSGGGFSTSLELQIGGDDTEPTTDDSGS